MFTWYSPTNPGANPANETGNSVPFTTAVTAVVATEYCPCFTVVPSPVAYTCSTCPRASGVIGKNIVKIVPAG